MTARDERERERENESGEGPEREKRGRQRQRKGGDKERGRKRDGAGEEEAEGEREKERKRDTQREPRLQTTGALPLKRKPQHGQSPGKLKLRGFLWSLAASLPVFVAREAKENLMRLSWHVPPLSRKPEL